MRTETIIDSGWEFALFDIGTGYDEAAGSTDAVWQEVRLPHDWLIYDTDQLYKDGSGWYRRKLTVSPIPGRRYFLNFDGVYMDSVVYVNGIEVGHNHYGYSAFEFDIPGQLTDGDNTIMVGVHHRSPNTRWYSGAGIFRDVTFKDVPDVHLATNGVYISSRREDSRYLVTVDTKVVSDPEHPADVSDISFAIRLLPAQKDNSYCISRECADAAGFVIEDASHGDDCSVCEHPCDMRDSVRVSDVETVIAEDISRPDEGEYVFRTTFSIDNPFVWDIVSPNLYELKITLRSAGGERDMVTERFGLREIRYTTDRGFYLNGRHVKLYGVCEHHDLGCLGAAFHKEAFRRKISILKEMGVNAIRTSHNMPARGVMELADEMGILIDSEAFDMWRHPKTEFDYARFFDEDHEKDVASWVLRDRNHPSVIMWSIGNEIYDCHADPSAPELTGELMETVQKYDYRGNASVTFGSNYMAWEGAQKCADVLKLAGYNYGERLYDTHHEAHPDWMIYGSETSSTVQSRGIYHFPLKVSVMADDDEQCSTLGNCSTSWGAKNVEYVIKADRDHDFSSGQFIWSGFDYIGEPTPYHTRNSYFGQIDTAGFPKDTFYIFKAEWTDFKKAPFVHLFPYWDFNEGQIIDVRIASNAPCMELFVNGISHGKKYVNHEKDEVLCPSWQVPYHRGCIEAVAYDENGCEVARKRRSSFGDVESIRYCRTVYGEKLAFFEIFAVDCEGNTVENANCRVNVRAKGGTLLGLDNGDSTECDQYKCSSRRLFAGRLLAVVEAAEGTAPDDVELDIEIDTDDIPIRKIEISCLGHGEENDLPKAGEAFFGPGHLTEYVKAVIYPENATYSDITWVNVNDFAVKSNVATIAPAEESESAMDTIARLTGGTADKGENARYAVLTAKGDGEFRLRCMTHNGTEKMQCISSLEFSAAGIGTAYLDPYDFIAGSLYSDHSGDVGNGNEKGVATPRGTGSYVGYENIDFGEFGSDEITIPIFALNGDDHIIGIWEGRPNDSQSRLLLEAHYCKPSIWNVYQPETYKLGRRVKGITGIYFTTDDKIHIKGFSFTRPDKAFSCVRAIDNSRIYGDSFTVGVEAISRIGNNVTIEFDDMNFDGRHAGKLVICGRSNTANNSIHLQSYMKDGSVRTTLLEFPFSDDFREMNFEVPDMADAEKIGFVFLPGSNFDLKWFRFYE